MAGRSRLACPAGTIFLAFIFIKSIQSEYPHCRSNCGIIPLMTRNHFMVAGFMASALILLPMASATTLARLSFEELTDKADLVATGTVTRSWTAWDAEHKYIWTHYEMSVAGGLKGNLARTVEFAEVGGMVDGVGMNVVGSVAYQTGEHVMVFLTRQPNGYLRTTGWGQGKYTVDANNRLHGDASLRQVEIVASPSGVTAASSVRSLDGMSLAEAAQQIVNRVRAHSTGAK